MTYEDQRVSRYAQSGNATSDHRATINPPSIQLSTPQIHTQIKPHHFLNPNGSSTAHVFVRPITNTIPANKHSPFCLHKLSHSALIKHRLYLSVNLPFISQRRSCFRRVIIKCCNTLLCQWRRHGNPTLNWLRAVLVVLLPTLSSVTTTTTACPSRGTSVRVAEGTGPKAGLCGTFLSAAAVGRTAEPSLLGGFPRTNVFL